MKKNIKILIILALFILLIALAYILYSNLSTDYQPDGLSVTTATPEPAPVASDAPDESPAPEEETQTGKELALAPDFTVYDAEGKAVHLSDFIGTPVVLNYWASWCGPCTHEMPVFQEKYLAYEGRVQFIMVNLTDGSRETVESAGNFIESMGYTFPVFFDSAYSASRAYGVSSIPASYFIGADGVAVAYAFGALDADTLQKGSDMIDTP